MRQRPSLFVTFAIGLACIAFGLTLGRPSPGQQQAPAAQPGPLVGRYLVTNDSTEGNVIVIDTVTGRCWSHGIEDGDNWQNLGSPVEEKKK